MKKILIFILFIFLSLNAQAKTNKCIDAYESEMIKLGFMTLAMSGIIIPIPILIYNMKLTTLIAKALRQAHQYNDECVASNYPRSVDKLYKWIIKIEPASRVTKSEFINNLEKTWYSSKNACHELFSRPIRFIGDGTFPGRAWHENREKQIKEAMRFRELENQGIAVAGSRDF